MSWDEVDEGCDCVPGQLDLLDSGHQDQDEVDEQDNDNGLSQ